MGSLSRLLVAAGVGVLAFVSCFAQERCACGGQDCITWLLNCTNCGFTFCGTPPEKTTTTPPLDNCKTSVAVLCSVARDNNNQPIVCNSPGKVSQCYQRNIKTGGYKCTDETLATYTGTSCCN